MRKDREWYRTGGAKNFSSSWACRRAHSRDAAAQPPWRLRRKEASFGFPPLQPRPDDEHSDYRKHRQDRSAHKLLPRLRARGCAVARLRAWLAGAVTELAP